MKSKRGEETHMPELTFLQDDEIQALHSKLQSIRGDLFTKEVMNTLLVAEDIEQSELSFSSAQSLSETQKIQHMKLEIEKMKAEARRTNAIARAFGR